LSGDNVKNILLRNSPPGDFEISTKVDFWGESTDATYQHGGLLFYQDDQNYVKLVRIVGGYNKIEMLAEVNGSLASQYSTPIASPVPLRLARTGNTLSAYYSSDGIFWRRLGEPVLVEWPDPRIGLTASSTLDVPQTTAYFDWFRVTSRCYGIAVNVQPPSGGTVASSPGDCNGGTGYELNTQAVLTATANPAYRFSSWSGDATSTDNPVDVIMNSDKTVTASFSPVGHQVFLPIVVKPVVNLPLNRGW
jgi:regulation of enolase protein 1 (concanavalin A-like superfamily)